MLVVCGFIFNLSAAILTPPPPALCFIDHVSVCVSYFALIDGRERRQRNEWSLIHTQL